MIDKDLEFISFLNFYENREKIREKYRELNYEQKRCYKMYVYSTCFEKEYTKDLMWDYLNVNWEWLIFVEVKLKEEYIKRKEVKV